MAPSPQPRRGRDNDPELDARRALEVIDDQAEALRSPPYDLLSAWALTDHVGLR